MLQIIVVFLCLTQTLTAVTGTYQAFNLSCINSSYVTSNSNPIQLTIPTYSLVDMQVDLRHLKNATDLSGVTLTLNIYNLDNGMNYSETLNMNVSATAYSLYAGNNLKIQAQYSITNMNDQLALTRSYLFENSVSAWVRPPEPLDQQQKTFLFVITSQDFVSLPYNVIGTQAAAGFRGYFLTKESLLAQMSSRQTTINSYSDYWNGFTELAMPYIPYFSNCQNNGDYLYFSQMIHNASECQLFGYQSTPINEFKFGSSAIADNCVITRNCIYDETASATHEYPVWSTLDSSSKYLFSVTALQYAHPYQPVRSFDKSELVQCKILTSEGDNTTSRFPLKTKITMGYYQESETARRMLRCEVEFSLYSTATSNFQYQLEVNFAPLNHTKILLDFGFKWYIYMLVFIIIGVISNVQFVIFWIYHILTTVKSKITFRIVIYLKMVKQILKGVFMAVFIAIFLIFLVQVVMNGTLFGMPFSTNFHSFWDYLVYNNIGYLADTNLTNIRTGRMGLSYIIISVYLAYHLSPLIVGKERKSSEYEEYQILGQKFKPLEWNRGKVLFGIYIIALCCSGYLYFTFSTFFNANIWFIIVMMQIAQMVLEQVLNSFYDDVLPCIPMKLSVGVLAYLATMGAIDLYYFMLGYLVDVGISTIERAYLSLIQEKISKIVEEKNEELHKFYLNLLNDEEEEQEKKSHQNLSQMEDDEFIMVANPMAAVQVLEEEVFQDYNYVNWRDVESTRVEVVLRGLFVKAMVEKGEGAERKENKRKYVSAAGAVNVDQAKENKKFELLNDSSAGMVQYWLQPIVVLMLWITYDSSGILSNFQIASQNCILYMLSSVILAFSYQLNVFIIFHVLELYFNFDYKSMIEELLLRFSSKSAFWVTDCEQWEGRAEGMDTKMKGCNRYCLSSQMFFIVSLFSFLMFLFIIGFNTIIAAGYNVLKDPFLVLIAAFWLLMVTGLQKLLKKFVYCFDIWDYKSFSTGRNRISEQIIEAPSAGIETENNINNSSMSSSQIRFTFKHIQEEGAREELKVDKRPVFQAKLKTICKKLEPTFEQEDFRLEYALKNKDYIRRNIEEILKLITSFPENDTAWLGKGEAHNMVLSKKKQARNIDPGVSEFVGSWLKRVEANRDKRQDDGIERERGLKRCLFCFRSWAIYYGHGGICLQCSRKMFAGSRHIKEE